jgi:hypothetical protein
MMGPYTGYDRMEITVSGGVENYDVRANTPFFDTVGQGSYLEVSSSGSSVYLKMNGSGNAAIPIAAGGEWAVADFIFTNLYLTNDSVSDAVVSLYMMGHR